MVINQDEKGGRNINMLVGIRELALHRDLLITWTIRDIKVRYKQSFLGAAWAILQPLAATIIFTLIFSRFVRVPTDGIPYPIFYYSALLPWTFTATAISFGVTSLINNMNLVTKIYFPREIMPLAAILASLVDFLVAALIFVGMMVLYQVRLSPSLVTVPLILFIQLTLMTGIVLLISALTVFYRDIRFAVPVGVQLWMYLTPIIYPLSMVPERFRSLYMLNPMAGVIDSYRRVILLGEWPQMTYLALAAVVSVVLLVGAYGFFKRAEGAFADII
jgi:lipopolysaccharide transport system permease protein